MQHNDLRLSLDHEYFIAIATNHDYFDHYRHSFLLLGVMDRGVPVLFTRVAKWAADEQELSQTCFFPGMLLFGRVAKLKFEGIHKDNGTIKSISYQAYSLTYEQVNEFLALIAAVEKDQNDNNNVFCSYVPDRTTLQGRQITFKWKKLQDCNLVSTNEKIGDIKTHASQLNFTENCRTTAIEILDAILGFATKLSSNLFSSLSYDAVLRSRQLDNETFYLWPAPPPEQGSDASKKYGEVQVKVLHKLYARLQEIPKLHPASKETREKYNAVKGMYKAISGEENLNVPDLLDRITQYEKNCRAKNSKMSETSTLYQNRGFFSFPTTTKRMMDNIKSDLQSKSLLK